jgi:hypothetical protein
MRLDERPGDSPEERWIDRELCIVDKEPDSRRVFGVEADTRLECFFCFMEGDREVKRIAQSSVDWTAIENRRYEHVRDLLKHDGPLTVERVKSWQFDDGYTARSRDGNNWILFRSGKDPAVLVNVDYSYSQKMFVDETLPLQAFIKCFQGVKGFTTEKGKAFKEQHHYTPQEAALRMLIQTGKPLWDAGWQLEFADSALKQGFKPDQVPWAKFLRKHYFTETPQYMDSAYLLNRNRKRVKELIGESVKSPKEKE